MRRRVLALTAAVTAATALAAQAGLLANGDFDASTAGWDTPPPFLTWATADRDGSPGSGSARTELFSGTGGQLEVEASPCFPLLPGDEYVVSGSVWIDEQGPEDGIGIGFKVYQDGNCSSGWSPRFWLADPAVTGWQTGRVVSPVVAGPVSFKVMLYSRDDLPANRIAAYFDGVELGLGGCSQGSTVNGQTWTGNRSLCLNQGRFRVSADWLIWSGASGEGSAVPLTADSGGFWFFDPDNLEVDVKVLDGCGVDGHYWVFAAGLTNVEVELTVEDTVTGLQHTYLNPLNRTFVTITDTSTFAVCP